MSILNDTEVKERGPGDKTADSSGINFAKGIAQNANESTCKDLTTGSEDKVFNRPSHGADGPSIRGARLNCRHSQWSLVQDKSAKLNKPIRGNTSRNAWRKCFHMASAWL